MAPTQITAPAIHELLRPQRPEQTAPTTPDAGPAEGAAPSFGEALEGALRSVDGELRAADELAARYVAGEEVDLHRVVLEMQKADMSFRTMLEVRNKLIDAYREIMQLQV
ncbi:MAG: flagellar hook-basal body complex protein FliE [Acidobacteriota bacterium]